MQTHIRQVIQNTFDASNEGRIHFGQVVGQLLAVHVESYHVDYRAGRSTYYLPDGTTLDLPFPVADETMAGAFDAAAVRAAIQGEQQGQVMYPEFKRLSQRAGCIGYTVWLTGRHVSYHGRRGETHVERFPD
ncbi:DUF1398 family protein [Hydrogenophaga sp.]|uniref:DUF1398 family protein n=1 Tax=Hydrogenophaga sp. TaxID=1904254 RepID=UPI00271FD808|nr:DUF1398 family protein [Hydrogenophaga sp.]MDO9134564.1 DUF1398 family protein [Hydrogenophaga sp.]